jgi:hypothetical protein
MKFYSKAVAKLERLVAYFSERKGRFNPRQSMKDFLSDKSALDLVLLDRRWICGMSRAIGADFSLSTTVLPIQSYFP